MKRNYRIMKLHEGMIMECAEFDENYDAAFYKFTSPAAGRGCFYADKYGVNLENGGWDEENGELICGNTILNAADITDNLRRLYGTIYDIVVWEDEEGDDENEESESV